MKTTLIILSAFIIGALFTLNAQSITVDVDDYQHVYEGGGASIGLYTGHHWSLSKAERDKVYKKLFTDCNMPYVQRYFGPLPSKDNSKYVSTINYVNEAREFNAGIKVSAVMSSIPEEYQTSKTVNGEEKMVLDINMPGVYDSLAYWYLEVMQYMHDGDADIDIFNLVNEPDFNKPYLFGYESNKKGVALIAQNVIPKLKELLADPISNPDGMVCPQICAPSTLSPYACLNYIKEWRTNYPLAWEQIDIVGTHQYAGGSGQQEVYDNINALLDGRGFMQTEQHTNRGDDIGDPPITKEHRGVISLGQVFTASVNGGVQSWWYFQTNYPQDYHSGGLIRIPWAGTPEYWLTYYAFKQLHNAQPANSNIIGRTVSNVTDTYTLALRKKHSDKATVHVTNKAGENKNTTLKLNGAHQTYGIKEIKTWKTDDKSRMELISTISFPSSVKEYKVSVDKYSLTSFEITMDTMGYDTELKTQNIVFPAFDDQYQTGKPIALEATSTSGLPVSYSIEEGTAIISGGNLYAMKEGLVRVSASQVGDTAYMPASNVSNDFLVFPDAGNVAEGKTASASSNYNASYTPEKAIDGDRISNGSRWLAANGSEFPQWIEIDLGGEHEIEGIGFWVGYDGYNKPFTEFTVQVMKDTLTTVLHESNNNEAYNVYTFAKTTTSKVRVTFNAGASSLIRLFELEVYGESLSSSIEDNAKDEFRIYPNPTDGNMVYIEGINPKSDINVYSLSGQLIPCHYNGVQLDISSLPSGIYLVKVDEHKTSRLIKH